MSTSQHRWVLSGGLASGKSIVREFFAESGVATIDADRVGHTVLEPDGPAFEEVADRWPQVATDGVIDRQLLASIVFQDPAQLAELESITHPHIFDTIKTQVEGIEGPVVVEVPLLSHGLGEGWRRIVVDCRDEVRLKRAVDRGMSEDDVRSRMRSQPSRQEWLASADLVIPNHVAVDELGSTVETVMDWL